MSYIHPGYYFHCVILIFIPMTSRYVHMKLLHRRSDLEVMEIDQIHNKQLIMRFIQRYIQSIHGGKKKKSMEHQQLDLVLIGIIS